MITVAKPVGSRIIIDADDHRKSIIDQVRIDCDPTGELRKSQQRIQPNMVVLNEQNPPIVHYNHPQQGGYHCGPSLSPSSRVQQGARLMAPPSPKRASHPMMSPSPSSSQLSYNDPRSAANQNVQKMAQMPMQAQINAAPAQLQVRSPQMQAPPGPAHQGALPPGSQPKYATAAGLRTPSIEITPP